MKYCNVYYKYFTRSGARGGAIVDLFLFGKNSSDKQLGQLEKRSNQC